MDKYEQRKKNREKQARFQERHRARLRMESAKRRRLAAIETPRAGGSYCVWVDADRLAYGLAESLPVGATAIVGGLTLRGARAIAEGLRRMVGEPRKPRPKVVPVFALINGTVVGYRSISAAARAIGIDRTALWRSLNDDGDCPVCGGFTDCADFSDYLEPKRGSDCRAWRGCTCD